MKIPVKVPDMVLVFLALCLTGASAFAVYVKPRATARVTISASEGEWVFPLTAEETVAVSGPLGDTIIRIHANEVWVEQSPCANQICVAQGRVRRYGGWAACLPNAVFFVIEGEETAQDAVDAMAW